MRRACLARQNTRSCREKNITMQTNLPRRLIGHIRAYGIILRNETYTGAMVQNKSFRQACRKNELILESLQDAEALFIGINGIVTGMLGSEYHRTDFLK
jgi:hypothetical protein